MERLVISEQQLKPRVSGKWQIIHVRYRGGTVTKRLNRVARGENRSIVYLVSPQVCAIPVGRVQPCIEFIWQDLLLELVHTDGIRSIKHSFSIKRWERFHKHWDVFGRESSLWDLDGSKDTRQRLQCLLSR